jgi:hypothetical protein
VTSLKVNRTFCVQFLTILAVWSLASVALAGGVGNGGALAGIGGMGGFGGGGMPWDAPVGTMRASAKNVVCPAMIFIGIVVAAGEMFHAGELGAWGKRGLVGVLAGGMGLGGDALITSMSSGGLVL